jgi:hypothetical protein
MRCLSHSNYRCLVRYNIVFFLLLILERKNVSVSRLDLWRTAPCGVFQSYIHPAEFNKLLIAFFFFFLSLKAPTIVSIIKHLSNNERDKSVFPPVLKKRLTWMIRHKVDGQNYDISCSFYGLFTDDLIVCWISNTTNCLL